MPAPKPLHTRFYEWISPLIFLSNNPISLLGVVVVTTATILWVFLLPVLFEHNTSNPYLGIPAFLLLPGLFIAGLVLIPTGIYFRRRSRQRQGLEVAKIGALTLDSPQLRRLLAFVGVASLVNIVIVSQWGYSAVTYMGTPSFCGGTCHVMAPEYSAYQGSPHSHVACEECHIGPGAASFVKAKVAGMRQVYGVVFNSYSRPIPAPVRTLRPARETCEECHWPARFSGAQMMVKTSYAADAENQASTTVLQMKVGGHTWKGGTGIHGVHEGDGISYIATDEKRQAIPQVTYRAPDGKVTVYTSSSAKATAADLAKGEHRGMDCVDCHNRPTHAFQLPERAVDLAINQGQISQSLPFIKREAVAALRKPYPNRDTASREIATALDNFYRTNYAQVYSSNATGVKLAISTVQAIYLRNVFPEMKVDWGTYPNNLGHTDFPGCFRCHDGDHVSADGRSIPNDCSTCHEMLAVEEKDPKILSGLGINAGAH